MKLVMNEILKINTIRSYLIIIICILAAGCSSSGDNNNEDPSEGPSPKEQNEDSTQATLYFPLTIGNIWQFYATVTDTGSPPYSEYTYQNVNKITTVNDAYVYNVKNDIETLSDENENILYSKWDDGIYYHGVNDPGTPVSLTYTPPILFLPSTFQVNDSWSTDSTLTINNKGVITTVDVTHNFNVVAIENVTVPAGTFLGCYKITMEIVSTVPDLNENIIYWFAEDIGMVKIESDGLNQDYVDELQYANVNGTTYGMEVVN